MQYRITAAERVQLFDAAQSDLFGPDGKAMNCLLNSVRIQSTLYRLTRYI